MYKRQIQERPNAKPLQLTRGGEIRFENVTFGYHPERPILKNATFTIPAGQKFAIVGPSGCGKSTILRLLFRFYDVESGRILIDGQDIRDVSLESLRKAIGVVPQDTPLFNNTIIHNIRYGRIDATDEEVHQAAERAHIDKLIGTLPNGYQTAVGERGMMISGGEKQRLAISRLILKDPQLLFFDEAVSVLSYMVGCQLTLFRLPHLIPTRNRPSYKTSTAFSKTGAAPACLSPTVSARSAIVTRSWC